MNILITQLLKRFRPRNSLTPNPVDELRVTTPNQEHHCECCLGNLIKKAGVEHMILSCLQQSRTKVDFVYKHPTKQAYIPARNKSDNSFYGSRQQGTSEVWQNK